MSVWACIPYVRVGEGKRSAVGQGGFGGGGNRVPFITADVFSISLQMFPCVYVCMYDDDDK